MWPSLWGKDKGKDTSNSTEKCPFKREREPSVSPEKSGNPTKIANTSAMPPKPLPPAKQTAPRSISPEMESLVDRLTVIMTALLDEKLKPISDDIKAIKPQMDKIRTDVEGLQADVELMQRIMNSKTLMFFGVAEKKKETFRDTEAIVQDLTKKMGINEIDIDNVRRFGPSRDGKVRPIELVLLRQKDKYSILNAKSNLRNYEDTKSVYINPAKTKLERKNEIKLLDFAKAHKLVDATTKFRLRNAVLEMTSGQMNGFYHVDKAGHVVRKAMLRNQAMEVSDVENRNPSSSCQT